MTLVVGCMLGGGAYAGFIVSGVWGAMAGGLAGTVALAATVRITIWLRDVYRDDAWKSVVVGDGRAEAVAEMTLWGALQYQAVTFPLSPAGASDEERHARRSIAYQIAAQEGLPLPVQIAAADALELMDQGQDRKQAQEAIRLLSEAVRECRTGYVRVNDDEAS